MSRIPIATYRLQLNRDFRFQDACALVPYLHRLGITDLYTSPLLASRRGSMHGYDVTDPLRLNPELGTQEEFEALVEGLQSRGMGLVLDIVPNHMAASPENPWWRDVLMHGPSSPYAKYFDIDWTASDQESGPKLILPILSKAYREVLENQELRLTLDEDGFSLHYWEVELPLDPKSYQSILAHRTPPHALAGLIEIIERLPPYASTDSEQVEARRRGSREILERLRQACNDPSVRAFLEENIRAFNGTKGDPDSFSLLDELLAAQPYRLAYWREGMEQLNYRRFFDITDLVGVRVEDPQVFEATHALVLKLVQEGKVRGIRVDHVDGLYDPTGYLQRLREHAPDAYLVVEKILAGDERLPQTWPVAGTTGYDFLNTVGDALLDPLGVSELEAVYRRTTGSPKPFGEIVYESKKQVILELFPGEVRRLARGLQAVASQGSTPFALAQEELVQALVEVTACLPVYRTYTRDAEISPRDRVYIEAALNEAEARSPDLVRVLAFLRHLLLLDFPLSLPPSQRGEWVRAVMRWQQFTGAVAAKGVEDTAFYRFHALISRNEVGGEPWRPPGGVEVFHHRNLTKVHRWPQAMNATSTHDTKRSEDVRARLAVLSEIPEQWAAALQRWRTWNSPKKALVNGRLVPDGEAEVLVYQTLIGAWPLQEDEVPSFRERLKAYFVKAAREAKIHTSWLDPDETYEHALTGFVDAILGAEHSGFLEDFLQFWRPIAYFGALNALGQVLLKVFAPGIPDFYQGTELWDSAW